jgi:hypothetical protein
MIKRGLCHPEDIGWVFALVRNNSSLHGVRFKRLQIRHVSFLRITGHLVRSIVVRTALIGRVHVSTTSYSKIGVRRGHQINLSVLYPTSSFCEQQGIGVGDVEAIARVCIDLITNRSAFIFFTALACTASRFKCPPGEISTALSSI